MSPVAADRDTGGRDQGEGPKGDERQRSPGRLKDARSCAACRGPACSCGLVDLIRARSRVRRAPGDVGADLLELELVSDPVTLGEGREVLGVTGLGVALKPHTLGRVVALLGGGERLIDSRALGVLLMLLGDLKAATAATPRAKRGPPPARK